MSVLMCLCMLSMFCICIGGVCLFYTHICACMFVRVCLYVLYILAVQMYALIPFLLHLVYSEIESNFIIFKGPVLNPQKNTFPLCYKIQSGNVV